MSFFKSLLGINAIGDMAKNISGLATGVTEISKSVGGLFSTEDEAQFGSLLNRIARDNPSGVQRFLEFLEWAFPFGNVLQQLGRVFYGNGFRKHVLSFPNPKNQPPPQSRVTGSGAPQNSSKDEREEEMRRMILILERFGNEALLLDMKRRGIPVTPEWIREHDPSKNDPNSTVSKLLRAEFIPDTQSFFMKLFGVFGVILVLLLLLLQCQPPAPY